MRIDPARQLAFSPDWDGGGVVFDGRSGDFWAVDRDVWSALRMAAVQRDSAALSGLPAEVLDSLLAHGIIRAS
ncbi:MAG: hypothetical protein JNM32_08490 [Dechloromonas sp.]|nr:hypothetical protein [Dechloromonas sp.]